MKWLNFQLNNSFFSKLAVFSEALQMVFRCLASSSRSLDCKHIIYFLSGIYFPDSHKKDLEMWKRIFY